MFWGDDMNVEKNMFTIGEMAKSIGITRKIILNYEAKGLITPDVKDGKNGNRYYTVDTFTKIRTVRILQKLGLSLDEIHAYLDGETDLLPLIRRLEAMRDEINLNIEKLYERANTNPTQIKEIHIDKQTIYRRTFTTESILDKTNILRDTAILAMREYGTDMTRRMYFLEYSLSAPNEISYCVAVPPESSGEHIVVLTPMRAICIYHHGAYEELPKVREKLLLYAKEHNLTPLGMCRHIYITHRAAKPDATASTIPPWMPRETQRSLPLSRLRLKRIRPDSPTRTWTVIRRITRRSIYRKRV